MLRSAAGLLVVALTVLPAAHAANEKLRIGSFGTGKASGPLLTTAELRECLAIEARVAGATDSGARERASLEKEKAELIRQGEALKAEREALDRTNVEAIEAYIAREKARDKAIDDFEVRSDAFNARVAAIDADRANFKQRCDNRRFDLVDEAAIRKGK